MIRRAAAVAALASLPAVVPAAARAQSEPPPASPPLGAPACDDALALRPLLLVQSDLVPYAGSRASTSAGDPVSESGFRLRRARVGLDAATVRGAVTPWGARLVMEAWSDGDAGLAAAHPSGPRVTDAFVEWRRFRAFRVAAGSLRVPFSLSRQIDEGDLRLPERPLVVQAVAPEWRAGAMLRGDLGLLRYRAAAMNTAPELAASWASAGALFVGRVDAEPVGPVGVTPWLRPASDDWWSWWRFAVGASGFYTSVAGADGNRWGAEGDLQLQWKRLALAAEGLWVGPETQRRGGYVEPGVYLWLDRLEVTGRFEIYDEKPAATPASQTWATTLGATFLSVDRRVRLQAAYAHRHERSGPQIANDWVVLRAAFVLGSIGDGP